jgi:Holliday junction resolvase RusA-like endonuclease
MERGIRMTLVAAFTIPGQPLPKQRPRFGGGHGYTSKATRDAEARVALSFTEQAGATHAVTEPLTGFLKFVARYYRRNNVTADLDNCLKLTTDALNGIAWVDDRQIKSIRADMAVDPDNPRTEIEIWTLGEEEPT